MSSCDQYWLKKTKIPKNLKILIEKHLTQNSITLDLGCAGGRICGFLSQKAKKNYAIDFNEFLISESSKVYPNVNFIHGNFSDGGVWKKVNDTLDLIVSDCAIRKDYVDLKILSEHIKKYLVNGGSILLRIQELNDLNNLISIEKRKKFFYSEQEIKECFSNYKVNVIKELYVQNFSSASYLKKFLERINIIEEIQKPYIKVNRSYLTIEIF